jgi:hypothetical protein
MTKKVEKKIFTNEFNIQHEIEMRSPAEILIFVDTAKDDCYGYTFPCKDGKISWDSNKSNWALLSDDVIKVAEHYAKTCHLIVFS